MISNISTLYSENYESTEPKNKKDTMDSMKNVEGKKEGKLVQRERMRDVIAEKESVDQEKKKQDEKEEKAEKNLLKQRKLREAIDRANQETRLKQTACEFSYDERTNRIAIKVKDKDTDEVIREIPAEETLEMLARIKEQAGLMLDEKL